ncbi:MAG TPA: hypothetical protein VNJ04_05105 [Gemmatimonadaceae bacterium]|nr:hypothetical protein [Gemmatimonadaceae bacterium]
MSSRDDMPAQPTTKQIPAADPVQVLLLQLKSSMDTGFRETNANIDLLSGDLTSVKAEVRAIQTWKGEQEARSTRTSHRVQQVSDADLEQSAQLAQERSAREALATKVGDLDHKQDVQLALLKQLVKLTEKPVVKLVATAIGTAILGYLSARGLR